MNTTILKVVTGSQAHGLATPDSDFDYRGVFVTSTSEILKLGGTTQQTSWIEGKEDDTSWEIGKFLLMAVKCNPTVLEVFKAPLVLSRYDREDYAMELRNLFPHIWNADDVKNAFIGYGLNQRKKFLDNKDQRAPKYAAAYLRVLYNAWELLSTGDFTVNLVGTPIYDQVKRFKHGDYQIGEVIQTCFEWETKVLVAHKSCKKETSIDPVNEFLLRVRKEFWA